MLVHRRLDIIQQELARKVPRYEAIVAALISHLDRSEQAKGTGIGDLLLAEDSDHV